MTTEAVISQLESMRAAAGALGEELLRAAEELRASWRAGDRAAARKAFGALAASERRVAGREAFAQRLSAILRAPARDTAAEMAASLGEARRHAAALLHEGMAAGGGDESAGAGEPSRMAPGKAVDHAVVSLVEAGGDNEMIAAALDLLQYRELMVAQPEKLAEWLQALEGARRSYLTAARRAAAGEGAADRRLMAERLAQAMPELAADLEEPVAAVGVNIRKVARAAEAGGDVAAAGRRLLDALAVLQWRARFSQGLADLALELPEEEKVTDLRRLAAGLRAAVAKVAEEAGAACQALPEGETKSAAASLVRDLRGALPEGAAMAEAVAAAGAVEPGEGDTGAEDADESQEISWLERMALTRPPSEAVSDAVWALGMTGEDPLLREALTRFVEANRHLTQARTAEAGGEARSAMAGFFRQVGRGLANAGGPAEDTALFKALRQEAEASAARLDETWAKLEQVLRDLKGALESGDRPEDAEDAEKAMRDLRRLYRAVQSEVSLLVGCYEAAEKPERSGGAKDLRAEIERWLGAQNVALRDLQAAVSAFPDLAEAARGDAAAKDGASGSGKAKT